MSSKANPHRGEVAITLDGREHVMRLTLGALAALEHDLGEDSLINLVQRFENNSFSACDLMALLCAGLQGGGADITPEALAKADIQGGPMAATRAAAELLARTFTS